jgi:hypothetical protein
MYDVSSSYTVCQIRELAQIDEVPTFHLERARDQVQLRTLIGILTGVMLDCGPQPGRTSPALRWSVIN